MIIILYFDGLWDLIDQIQQMNQTNKTFGRHYRSQSDLITIKAKLQQAQQIGAPKVKAVSTHNHHFNKVDKMQLKRVYSDTKMINAFHPQLQKRTIKNVYGANKLTSLRELLQVKLKLENKLKTQRENLASLENRNMKRAQELQMKRLRETTTRQKEVQRRKQFQRSRRADQQWKERTISRQKSETSFLLQTHRDSLDVLKNSRMSYRKKERSLTNESFRETMRNSSFFQEKRRLQREKQHYENEYKKSFLKNSAAPKQRLSEDKFFLELKEKSRKLAHQIMGPKYLPSINNKRKSDNASKSKGNANELMISSFKPKKLPAVKGKDAGVIVVDTKDKQGLDDQHKVRESAMSQMPQLRVSSRESQKVQQNPQQNVQMTAPLQNNLQEKPQYQNQTLKVVPLGSPSAQQNPESPVSLQ